MNAAVSRILVVEDGHEYTEAFTRLLPPGVEIVRAASFEEAREWVARGPIDGVFLDVVFDRVPEASLTGDLQALIRRFGGDRARAVAHLQENQGFYVLDALVPCLAKGTRVLIAWDFTAEPKRFAALTAKCPGLMGLNDGSSLSAALAKLT